MSMSILFCFFTTVITREKLMGKVYELLWLLLEKKTIYDEHKNVPTLKIYSLFPSLHS